MGKPDLLLPRHRLTAIESGSRGNSTLNFIPLGPRNISSKVTIELLRFGADIPSMQGEKIDR